MGNQDSKKEQSKKITFAVDREIKEIAEKKFQSYGIGFGSGINILLKFFIDEKIQIFK